MTLKKEVPAITMILLPFIYLGYIWQSLPSTVPLHWNSLGQIDRYGDKHTLLLLPILLPLLTYIIFIIAKKTAPKKQLHTMGAKYRAITFLVTAIMAILALVILYMVKNKTTPNAIILCIGVLYLILGNYFKILKPNYFIGIRTPWTLASTTVWKKTHKIAGVLWFLAGIAIVGMYVVVNSAYHARVFLSITTLIALLPVCYSYILYKKEKNTTL